MKIPTALSEEQKQIVLEFARLERDTPGTVNGIHPSEQGKTRRSRAETREEETRATQEESADSEEKEGFFQRWKKKLLGRLVSREIFMQMSLAFFAPSDPYHSVMSWYF